MSARLIVLGIDALEPTALEPGRYPNIESFAALGAHGTIAGSHLTLTDSVWPELRTGMSVETTGTYYQPAQFRSGETRPRALLPPELTPDRMFWNVAAAAGNRVLAADMPLAPQTPRTDITEIGSWGTHDRPFDTFATAGSAQHAIDRAGRYPIWICNPKTEAGRTRLPDQLRDGIDMKVALYGELLDADEWDLACLAFSEAHCAGHHFWPPEEEGVLQRVYQHLDTAVGEVLTAAGQHTTVVLYTSHGMRAANDAVFLVAEVLEAMGLVSNNRARRRASALLPEALRPLIRRVVGSKALARAGFTYDRPIVGETAVPLPNSHHGAVRLALADRDPTGTIVTGSDDHARLIDRIRTAFVDLRLPTGGPAVQEVVIVDDLYGSDRNPDLPDIVIRFREDVGLIPEVHSEELGVLTAARSSERTGEHGTPGAIWAAGPGIEPGTALGDVQTIDLAPTVMALLGAEPEPWMEGSPIRGIVG